MATHKQGTTATSVKAKVGRISLDFKLERSVDTRQRTRTRREEMIAKISDQLEDDLPLGQKGSTAWQRGSDEERRDDRRTTRGQAHARVLGALAG